MVTHFRSFFQADMVPLPEASFTSVSVSGTSSSAAAARDGGEGDEVSSPLRAPGVRGSGCRV